jgi:hypothetical protein
MLCGNVVRGGILCVLLAALTLSCGETSPTEPNPPSRIVAVPASEVFLTSPQQEKRELLIDGRATDIEWNLTGSPVMLLMKGNTGTGGEYYASVRAYWTYNPFGGTEPPDRDTVAFYLLVQWADRGPDRIEQPLITSVDWQDNDNHSLIDCDSSDPLHDEANWHQNLGLHEDQVEVEIYSDPNGAYPADKWRWGAATTDPVTPTSSAEFSSVPPGSPELFGQNDHPTGGWSEDFYNSGAGWVLDAGLRTQEDNHLPGSNVPLFIAGKSPRDVRMNRGKPASVMIWKYVANHVTPCDSLNPIRLEDASVRQKTWNPKDYVQSYVSQMPDSSQADVVSRGEWDTGKWAVEMRRLLLPHHTSPTLNFDDVPMHAGQTYGFRLRIYNASKTEYSESQMVPLYIKPR